MPSTTHALATVTDTVAYARELRELYRSAEQRAVRFRLLVEMGRDLAQVRDLDALLNLALERALIFSGHEAGAVLLQGEPGQLTAHAIQGVLRPAALRPLVAAATATLVAGQPTELYADPRSPVEFALAGGITAAVLLPLSTGESGALGVLLLASAGSFCPLDADDLDALQLLASQLATAVASARLHEERARLVAQLVEREQRLEELVTRLIGAQEEERRRVAYELHDGLAQMAVGVLQHLHILADRYKPRAPASRKALERAVTMARATVTEARRVIAGLRPTALDDFGLAMALSHYVAMLQREGWELSYDEQLGPDRLPAAIETALFRVAQEALSNVGKHAGTTRAHVALWRDDGAVWLRVRDRGRGFSPDCSPAPAHGERIGLLGMQERIVMLGGLWRVESQPGHGTLIEANLPLAPGGGGRDDA